MRGALILTSLLSFLAHLKELDDIYKLLPFLFLFPLNSIHYPISYIYKPKMSAKSFREILGAPPSSASTKDSTLIIIDAQNEYVNGALKTENITGTRKSIARLLEKFRQSGNGKNIVHVVHQVPEGAPVFTPNTELAQEFEEITPKGNEKVVTKKHPSSFAQTDLHEYLQGLGDVGKKVVLVGYMAHVCVSTTARAAAELGYDPVIVKEAVGDRDIPGVKAETLVSVVLNELADAFGTVISENDISA
jgi:nicotinamidase-related amidase